MTLVERKAKFISCPISNLVLGGTQAIEDVTVGYDGLAKTASGSCATEAVAVDPDKRTGAPRERRHARLRPIDLSPGIDFMWDERAGLRAAGAQAASRTPGKRGHRR